MKSPEIEPDWQLAAVLDEAAAELGAGRTPHSSDWQNRYAQFAEELPGLLETLSELVTAAENWKADVATTAYRTGDTPLPEQIDRYRILGIVGAGGMGTVYRAHDPELDRIVALKVPRFDRPGSDPSVLRQRFLREARAAAQVRHAHVCPIHDVGEHEGTPFVVMAYVEGQSLADRLCQRGRYDDVREAGELVRQVALGLAAIHAQGITHRDLKPANILIDSAGQALLTDFGLALPANDAEHLTSPGLVVGTVSYMAPEQAAGQTDGIGPRSDLYSLGVVLYQMLTGRLPFEGPPLSILARLGHEAPPPLSQFRNDLDTALEAIVRKAMAVSPATRFQSAQDLALALERWLAGLPATPDHVLPATEAAPASAATATIVRSELPGGGSVMVTVPHGTVLPSKLTVTITEQQRSKRRQRTQRTIRVTLAFGVLIVFGFFLRTMPTLLERIPHDRERIPQPVVTLVEPKEGPDRPPPSNFDTSAQAAAAARPGAPTAPAAGANVLHEWESTLPELEARVLVAKVSRRLLPGMDRLPDNVLPPSFEIVKEGQVNAFATAKLEKQGKEPKLRPLVVVTSGLLERVVRSKDDRDGDEDRLAFILSHELGHVALGHVVRPAGGGTAFVQQAFNRQQEIDADLKGMELALKAGYSFRRGRTAIDRMKQLGLTYSSFEGQGANHPSWNDRLALLDKDQAKLWKAMSAFETGAFFLQFEQYASAERCFREVVKEFPECYEAWTNLGDALLMQYCDALDLDDLRRLNVGQIAIGAFYSRPESLEVQVRGMDDELWKEAVEALGKALKLKPDLALAKANLGVAHLLSPHGKDVKKASEYLQEAADKVVADRSLSALMRAAVLINASVADLAAGRLERGEQKQLQAADTFRRSVEGLPQAPVSISLFCALLYNRALSLSLSSEEAKRRGAVEVFEQYLTTANPSSTWWSLGYERYTKSCKNLNLTAKTKQQLANKVVAGFRPVTSVKLAPGVTVALSEPVKEAVSRLGEGTEVPVVRGTKLVRWRFPDKGIELIATDRVLAIILRGPKAPPLPLQGSGPGGEIKQLRQGMAQQELEQVLANEEYDVRQLDQAQMSYRFYPGLGLAVRAKDGKVEEMVVAQVPRRRGLER